jgi:hypothetical protein
MTVFSSPNPFTRPVMAEIFPQDRTDRFFEALLGDAGEGAYDIDLVYVGESEAQIRFEFQLRQRPGRCMACNLTYGLPEVFIRHPVIDLAGLIRQIDSRICNGKRCGTWQLGRTREVSRSLHVLPLSIDLVPDHQGSNRQR